MNQKEYYTCTKSRLYSYLVEHGEMPVMRRIDRYNPKFFVWLFPNTDRVNELVKDYYDELAAYKAQQQG